MLLQFMAANLAAKLSEQHNVCIFENCTTFIRISRDISPSKSIRLSISRKRPADFEGNRSVKVARDGRHEWK